MTVQDVSQNLDVQWNTVKQIEKQRLQVKYKKIDLSSVTHIAIDEFSIKKGHIYQTVVMDLKTRRIIYIGMGRAQDCLDVFWKKVKQQKVCIETVAMDMWPAYIGSVSEHSPDSHIVFDKFHIIKKLNEAISDVRRMMFHQETDLNNKKLLKGTRWLLLYNRENLKEKGSQRLQEALAINIPLAQAYYLKEDLQLLWDQLNEQDANQFLNLWCEQAYSTGLTPLKKIANMLKSHRTGILNWYKHQISTGPLEGMNNKIKVLKRKAYGYRDIEYFNLKILDLHTSRYALI